MVAAEKGVGASVDEQYEILVQKALARLDWCKSSTDRKSFEQRCDDAQRFWKGDQWSGIKSYGIPGRSAESKKLHPNPVDNYFKAHIEGLVGDITDRPPDIQLRPREPGDEDSARLMEEVVHYIWYRNNGDRKLEFAVRRACLYGPLIAKVYWDPDWVGSPGNPFIGDVRFFNVLPTQFFVDPRIKATENGVIQQAEFVIYAVRRSLAYIKKHYPERGGEVTADSYAAYVDTISGPAEEALIGDDDSTALLIEYWYKGQPMAPDFPKVEREILAPKDIERADGVHVAIIAGGVLLKHVTYAAPYYPFVMEWLYPSDDSIYGYGDAHDILMPQLIINKLNEIAIEGAALASQGNWVVEDGVVRNVKYFQKFASRGGSVLPVADIQRVQRQLGGNVPGSLFMHYRQEQQAMEAVSGRYDIAQGRSPRNVRAASAIAMLLQQAGGRVRQRARAVASFIEQITHMIIDLVLRHYTEERMIRVVGKDGALSWKYVSRESFLKRKVVVDPLTGEETVEEYTPEFDVIVTSGTDTPVSKAYYTDLAVQLFQLGVIDDIALLEILQFPRWREILARKGRAVPQPGGGEVQPTAAPEMEAQREAAAMEVNPYANIGGSASSDVGRLIEVLRSLETRE